MTTSLKDVSSAQMIHSLVEMNCFAQECNVYGYMWKDSAGHIKYTTSDDESVIRRSFERKVLAHYEMTPIKSWTAREIVKEETKDDLWMYLKLRLCEALRLNYDQVYFQTLNELCSLPADNQAWDILYPWLQEIDGYYDEDALQLFEGAVNYAIITKHLGGEACIRIRKWLQKTRSQIAHRMQVKDNFERTFVGFAYDTRDKQYAFFYNANQKALFDRQKELEQQGVFHTPLYTKQYWYHNSSELKDVRTKFQAEMKLLMDNAYFMRINALRNLTHKALSDHWASCLLEVRDRCSEVAVEGLLYWGYRWNINR